MGGIGSSGDSGEKRRMSISMDEGTPYLNALESKMPEETGPNGVVQRNGLNSDSDSVSKHSTSGIISPPLEPVQVKSESSISYDSFKQELDSRFHAQITSSNSHVQHSEQSHPITSTTNNSYMHTSNTSYDPSITMSHGPSSSEYFDPQHVDEPSSPPLSGGMMSPLSDDAEIVTLEDLSKALMESESEAGAHTDDEDDHYSQHQPDNEIYKQYDLNKTLPIPSPFEDHGQRHYHADSASDYEGEFDFSYVRRNFHESDYTGEGIGTGFKSPMSDEAEVVTLEDLERALKDELSFIEEGDEDAEEVQVVVEDGQYEGPDATPKRRGSSSSVSGDVHTQPERIWETREANEVVRAWSRLSSYSGMASEDMDSSSSVDDSSDEEGEDLKIVRDAMGTSIGDLVVEEREVEENGVLGTDSADVVEYSRQADVSAATTTTSSTSNSAVWVTAKDAQDSATMLSFEELPVSLSSKNEADHDASLGNLQKPEDSSGAVESSRQAITTSSSTSNSAFWLTAEDIQDSTAISSFEDLLLSLPTEAENDLSLPNLQKEEDNSAEMEVVNMSTLISSLSPETPHKIPVPSPTSTNTTTFTSLSITVESPTRDISTQDNVHIPTVSADTSTPYPTKTESEDSIPDEIDLTYLLTTIQHPSIKSPQYDVQLTPINIIPTAAQISEYQFNIPQATVTTSRDVRTCEKEVSLPLSAQVELMEKQDAEFEVSIPMKVELLKGVLGGVAHKYVGITAVATGLQELREGNNDFKDDHSLAHGSRKVADIVNEVEVKAVDLAEVPLSIEYDLPVTHEAQMEVSIPLKLETSKEPVSQLAETYVGIAAVASALEGSDHSYTTVKNYQGFHERNCKMDIIMDNLEMQARDLVDIPLATEYEASKTHDAQLEICIPLKLEGSAVATGLQELREGNNDFKDDHSLAHGSRKVADIVNEVEVKAVDLAEVPLSIEYDLPVTHEAQMEVSIPLKLETSKEPVSQLAETYVGIAAVASALEGSDHSYTAVKNDQGFHERNCKMDIIMDSLEMQARDLVDIPLATEYEVLKTHDAQFEIYIPLKLEILKEPVCQVAEQFVGEVAIAKGLEADREKNVNLTNDAEFTEGGKKINNIVDALEVTAVDLVDVPSPTEHEFGSSQEAHFEVPIPLKVETVAPLVGDVAERVVALSAVGTSLREMREENAFSKVDKELNQGSQKIHSLINDLEVKPVDLVNVPSATDFEIATVQEAQLEVPVPLRVEIYKEPLEEISQTYTSETIVAMSLDDVRQRTLDFSDEKLKVAAQIMSELVGKLPFKAIDLVDLPLTTTFDASMAQKAEVEVSIPLKVTMLQEPVPCVIEMYVGAVTTAIGLEERHVDFNNDKELIEAGRRLAAEDPMSTKAFLNQLMVGDIFFDKVSVSENC
jgi:hypothetical protein